MRLGHFPAVVCVALMLLAIDGVTEPVPEHGPSFAHLHSPRLACLGTVEQLGSCVQLSEGYFLDELTFAKLDTEVKRLQDAETRLRAENDSLRKSAQAWQPGWVTLTAIAVASAVLTVYVEHKL